MTLDDFLAKCNISARDTFAAKKVFSGQEKTEKEWKEVFEQNFNFKMIESPKSKGSANNSNEK